MACLTHDDESSPHIAALWRDQSLINTLHAKEQMVCLLTMKDAVIPCPVEAASLAKKQ